MKELHWSKTYVSFITIEIPYNDGARQGWGYDCEQYASIDTLKANMFMDFSEPRMDRGNMSLCIRQSDIDYSAEVEIDDLVGEDFVELVFSVIEGMLNVN